MRALLVPVEMLLETLASWTVAYHFALLTNLPAGLSVIPFLALLVPALGLSLRGWKPTLRAPIQNPKALIGLALCALTTGALTLVASRPDNDDVSFFHRALVQLPHLDRPFVITDTLHNRPGLPALSLLHVMTSYEPGVALVARALRTDPLGMYQNGSAFLAGTLLPVVYVLLYRHFRVRPGPALVAAMGALGFLLLDGNLHRSFGNVALVRLWQGKTILWTLFLPITSLVALRFLSRPSTYRLGMVVLAAICATGLSNSGIILIPVLLLGLSIAYVLGYGFTRARLMRALTLNGAGFYCVALAVAVAVGIIPRPIDTTVWAVGRPSVWWENIALVLGDPASLARDVLILGALPLAMLRGPLARLPVLLTLALCLLFANPLLGPWWIARVQPGSYWRLAYLFPLPWCAGLLLIGLPALTPDRRGIVRAAIMATTALAALSAYRVPALSATAGTSMKAIGEYKFRAADMEFARRVAKRLEGRNVLASEDVVAVLALFAPSLRFEAGRTRETLHIFRNARDPEEGMRRVAAQHLVSTGVRSYSGDRALLGSLRAGVDAIILPPAHVPQVFALISPEYGHWEEAERDGEFALLLRREENRP